MKLLKYLIKKKTKENPCTLSQIAITQVLDNMNSVLKKFIFNYLLGMFVERQKLKIEAIF